jgi:Bacterial TSP3 repeat
MSKWLVLTIAVLAYAPAASAAARHDRDHDGLRDRAEVHRYHTNPHKKDTDGDRLRDGAEVHRYHTNPRRKDTDRDGLRDGAEVHRYHTNPRKRDTDGDGVRDGVEIRAGTNPHKPRSHPHPNSTPPPPGTTPPPPGGFPNPASTGVPAGWVPATTRSTDLTVTTPGAVVQDIRFTGGARILVKADNVTIRRVDMQGGIISNQYGSAPAGCGHNLLIEDTTFEQVPGKFEPSDYPVIGEGSYTARRIEVDGRGEGPRFSDCGPVTLEDSFIKIHGADPGTAACDAVHSDGVQAVAGVGATARNNTIIMQTYCGTSAWFVVNPAVNKGRYDIDRLLVSGAGYTFRQQVAGSVTGLRIVNDSWVYGPLAEMDCSVLSPWDAKLVTIDSNYQVTATVRDLPCD